MIASRQQQVLIACVITLVFALLLALRALWLSGDPSDFPLDRNMSTLIAAQAYRSHTPLESIAQQTGTRAYPLLALVPELQAGPWLAARLNQLGIPLTTGARAVSLLAALLAGWGLFLVVRRLCNSPFTASLAVLIFALNPLAIFMGRALLPDGLMMAAVVWAFAFATQPRRPLPALVFSSAFLTLATLLKLPALWFGPAVYVAWLTSHPHGHLENPTATHKPAPRRLILCICLAAFIVWLATCAWYRLAPWYPFPGFARLNANTNNLGGNWRELVTTPSLRVAWDRLLLAWTLPGTLLVLIGMCGRRACAVLPRWVWCWFVLSLAFLLLSVRANVYWAFAAVPVGAVVGAAGLRRLLASPPRWSVLALGALLISLYADRSFDQLQQNFYRPSRYHQLKVAAAGMHMQGTPLFEVGEAFVAQWFTGRAGIAPLGDAPEELISRMLSGDYSFVLSGKPNSPLVRAAFTRWPIRLYDPSGIVLFESSSSATIGKPATVSTSSTLIANRIRISIIAASHKELSPGSTLQLAVNVASASTEAPSPAPYLTAQLFHLETGKRFAIPPSAGGGRFFGSEEPLIQLPDLSSSATQTIQFAYTLPTCLPAGEYGLALALKSPDMQPFGDAIQTPALFKVIAHTTASTTAEIRLLDAIRTQPQDTWKLKWWGRQDDYVRLADRGTVAFGAQLPAGKYTLKLRAAADNAGDPPDNWPVVEIRQSSATQELKLNHADMHTYEIPIDWHGPADWIELQLKNPLHAYYPPHEFPVYLNEVDGKLERAAILDRVSLTPLK